MPSSEHSVLARYSYPVIFGVGGFGFFAALNLVNRRPVLSGIHRHIIGGIVGVFIGDGLLKYRRYVCAERDAVILHYMKLHPEDFQPEEKKKYKDILQPWTPVR